MRETRAWFFYQLPHLHFHLCISFVPALPPSGVAHLASFLHAPSGGRFVGHHQVSPRRRSCLYFEPFSSFLGFCCWSWWRQCPLREQPRPGRGRQTTRYPQPATRMNKIIRMNIVSLSFTEPWDVFPTPPKVQRFSFSCSFWQKLC